MHNIPQVSRHNVWITGLIVILACVRLGSALSEYCFIHLFDGACLTVPHIATTAQMYVHVRTKIWNQPPHEKDLGFGWNNSRRSFRNSGCGSSILYQPINYPKFVRSGSLHLGWRFLHWSTWSSPGHFATTCERMWLAILGAGSFVAAYSTSRKLLTKG